MSRHDSLAPSSLSATRYRRISSPLENIVGSPDLSLKITESSEFIRIKGILYQYGATVTDMPDQIQ